MRIDDRSDSGAARGPRRLDLRNRSSARRRETSESRQGARCAGDSAADVALQSRRLEPSNVAQSASTQIVRAIIRGLYEGAFASGQRLIEPELMTQFDVSRSTVRESIRRMESEGIVTVVPHRGAAIRKMSVAEALDALMVMQLCVGLAARQAAERIEAHGGRERFEKAWGELQECRHLPDGYDLLLARNRFYRAITEISENHELRRIIPSIQVHLIRRNYSLSSETRFEDYAQMAKAILAGDGAAAEAAARRHIARSIKLVKRRLAAAEIETASGAPQAIARGKDRGKRTGKSHKGSHTREIKSSGPNVRKGDGNKGSVHRQHGANGHR
jgi:DNA-binding GntR family transcriptional regulator